MTDQLEQLDLKLANERDPAKITELRGQYRTTIQRGSLGISDPDARELWLLKHLAVASKGEKAADQRGIDVWRGTLASGLDEKLANEVRRASQTDDPAAHQASAESIRGLIAAGVAAGTIPAEQESKRNRDAADRIITGTADWLDANGQPERALGWVRRNKENLPADKFNDYVQRLEGRGSAARIAGGAMRALGQTGAGSGGVGGGLSVGGAIPTRIDDEAKRQGFDSNDALTIAQIESSMGQNLGRRANIFQLGGPEKASVGGMGADIDSQVTGGITFLVRTKEQLQEALGREPAGWEVYLGHQQGVGGAITLLNNPNAPAGSLLPPANISANGGDPAAPASDFVAKWRNTFERTAGRIGGTSGGGVEVWGDSLGVGLKGQLKVAGTVHSGDTPETIFGNIKRQPEDYWRGKTVALPSGSNGDQMPVVEDTIKYLKDRGANVIAIGYGPKFPEKNAELQAIAGRQGVSVVAAEDVGAAEGVHPGPKGYAAMAQKIRAAVVPGGSPVATTGKPNRTGLPTMAEIWRNVQADVALRDDKERVAAFDRARIELSAMEAEAQRAERIAVQQKTAVMNERIAAIQRDAYSDNPTITAREIANDPIFDSDPKMREHMIGFISNPPGSGISAPRSAAAAQALVERIRRPEGDPQKITDRGQIYDAMRELSRPDFEFVIKQFDEIRSPGGERFAKQKAGFIKRATSMITKSNLLMGDIDSEGDAQLWNFEWALDQKIEEYRKAGKNPNDLLSPQSSDFMGHPKVISQFQTTFQESTRKAAKTLTAVPTWPGLPVQPPAAAAPGPLRSTQPGAQNLPGGGVFFPIPSVTLRLPGESAADYMRRIGMGAPLAPAAPTISAPAP